MCIPLSLVVKCRKAATTAEAQMVHNKAWNPDCKSPVNALPPSSLVEVPGDMCYSYLGRKFINNINGYCLSVGFARQGLLLSMGLVTGNPIWLWDPLFFEHSDPPPQASSQQFDERLSFHRRPDEPEPFR
jgi:hypothetical protein